MKANLKPGRKWIVWPESCPVPGAIEPDAAPVKDFFIRADAKRYQQDLACKGERSFVQEVAADKEDEARFYSQFGHKKARAKG